MWLNFLNKNQKALQYFSWAWQKYWKKRDQILFTTKQYLQQKEFNNTSLKKTPNNWNT